MGLFRRAGWLAWGQTRHRPQHMTLDVGLGLDGQARGERQRQQLGVGGAAVVDQLPHRNAEQRTQRLLLQRGAIHAHLEQRTPVGGQNAATARKRHHALEQRADELGARVEMQPDGMLVGLRKNLVLDDLGRHAGQRHGVAVVATCIARHIQHPGHRAPGAEDGCAGAGQKLVDVQKMLVGMHGHGPLQRNRRADGVGALGCLGPVHTGFERHFLGPRQKRIVAHRVQDAPGPVGQNHHAVGVGNLLVQGLQHRIGQRAQLAALLQQLANVGRTGP